MKRNAWLMILAGLVIGLTACMDPVIPRLPDPGDESPNDTSSSKRGYEAPAQPSPGVR